MPIEADGLTLNDGADLRRLFRKGRLVVVVADDERRFEVGKISDEPRFHNVAAMDDLIDPVSFEDVQSHLNHVIVIMRIAYHA